MRIGFSVQSRALLLSCMMLVPSALFAGKYTDVIVMKNGDRITGNIKALDGGRLSVSLDYVDGTISLDWLKVVRLESSKLFVVFTSDGASYEGRLVTTQTEQPVKMQVLTENGNRVEIDSAQVVRMSQTSDTFHERLTGNVDFGVIYSKGNQATQYSFGTAIDYLRPRWAAGVTYNSNLSASRGSPTSTRNQLGLSSYRLLSWRSYFYEGVGNFLQSSVQGITLQTTLGGGIGYFFKDTNRARISVLGGVAWQGTNYKASASQSPQNIAVGLISAEAKFFKFRKTNLDVSASLMPAFTDPGRVRFNTNASYYLKIFRNLSWNLSFYGNWDNQPPQGLSASDYGSSSGLSWTFGNK